MSLQTYQHNLLRLIKRSDTATPTDPYLAGLQADGSIDRIRQIATWWRKQQISRYCPLTYKALARLGQIDNEITAFYESQTVSVYIEQAGLAFLGFVQHRYAGLLNTVSQFEQAVIETRTLQCLYKEVVWNVDPEPILSYLTSDEPVEDQDVARGQYRTRHYADETVRFEIVCLSVETAGDNLRQQE